MPPTLNTSAEPPDFLAKGSQATNGTRALRPNIVWIMADDLGWGEVGIYPAESPHGRIATPNLDRLGREGVVFSHAYAGYTVCAPSRTAFFIGRHSGHFRRIGVDGMRLRPEQGVLTSAQVLQHVGYATGAFGKMAPLTSPLDQGFDYFVGQVDQDLCHNMYPREIDFARGQLNYELSGNYASEKGRVDCMSWPERYNYSTDVFHAQAMAWMEATARGDRPFFLYLSFTVPHAGGWGDAPQSPETGSPVPTDLQYSGKDWPDVEKDHAATITYMDAKVGDLMERLQRLGIDERTLVFFASDNGAHVEGGHVKEFFNSTGGLRGCKRSLYDGGVRSPSMARWPGHIPPRLSEFPWSFWDVLPTFAELAGAATPTGLDGVSILPTLLAQPQAEHAPLIWTWPGEGPGPSGYAIRAGRWKGVVRHCSDHHPHAHDVFELFDLEVDPFETRDVAASHADIVAWLAAHVASEDITCDCFQCGINARLV